MLKDAYTTQEIASLMGVVSKNAIARAGREDWQSRKRAKKLGGDEWLVSSMPESTRALIASRVAEQTTALVPVSGPLLATDIVIPDWSFDMAKARFRIVMEWRAFIAKAGAKGTKKKEASERFLDVLKSGFVLPVAVLERLDSYSIPSIYRWNKELREHGDNMDVLADKRGKWRQGGPKGLGQLGAETESLILKAWLTPNKWSMSHAHRVVKDVLEEKGLPVPSYDSVRRFLERFDRDHHDVVVFRREGEKAYADKVGPYLSRNDKILHVGDVLVSDGHKMNFKVINPETGKECRMTLIGWQDWASRMFVAFEIMLNENTQAIAASFHRALLNLGKKCKIVYIDNGKAFKNKFFDGDPDLEDFDGLYLRLGIDPQHSAPYVARTKIIERWWGDFDRQCARMLDSYVGASIEEKPAHLLRNETWHQERREKLGLTHVPTVAEVVRVVTEYAKWKALQPHPTRPETTPWEMFQAGRGPGFTEAEQADLARQFLHRERVNPARGRFTLYNVEYEGEVLDLLHGTNKQLMAHYAYSNLSEIYLYDEGRYIGKAHPVSTTNPMAAKLGTEFDVQTLKTKQKEFARMRRDTRKLAEQIDDPQAALLLEMRHMRPASERRTPLQILPGGKALEESPRALPAPALTEAEYAELEAVAEASRAKLAAKPAYETPSFFGSRLERYEFLFSVVHEQGHTATADDAAFMAGFEGSREYEAVRPRYDRLQAFFQKQKEHVA